MGLDFMIKATKLNQAEFYINPDLIEFMEETPDTVITLTTGVRLVVSERALDIIDRIIAFRRQYYLDRPFIGRPER
jgi:flagellar protein FlbD